MSDEAKQGHEHIELWGPWGNPFTVFRVERTLSLGIEIGGSVVIKPVKEWHALALSSETTQKLNPAVLPALPGQKALTVVMLKDDGDVQADAAIQAIKDGTSTFFVQDPGELFFHQLRLRAALDPSLADKIAVYYLQPETRQWKQVRFVKAEDQLKWPVGFLHDGWEKETQISAVRGMADHPDKVVDTARDIAAELRRKYGC